MTILSPERFFLSHRSMITIENMIVSVTGWQLAMEVCRETVVLEHATFLPSYGPMHTSHVERKTLTFSKLLTLEPVSKVCGFALKSNETSLFSAVFVVA